MHAWPSDIQGVKRLVRPCILCERWRVWSI